MTAEPVEIPVAKFRPSQVEDYVVPPDTRYIPLQQQPYCCVPTCVQMIMLRHNIPLRPAEELGAYMGLIVPPEDAGFFYNPAVVSPRPEIGYGSAHVVSPETHPNNAFERLDIPLRMEEERIDLFDDAQALEARLHEIVNTGLDALLCLRWADVMDSGTIIEPVDMLSGHVVVVDTFLDNGNLRIIDPARGQKWREYPVETLYKSAHAHTPGRGGGIWVFRKTS